MKEQVNLLDLPPTRSTVHEDSFLAFAEEYLIKMNLLWRTKKKKIRVLDYFCRCRGNNSLDNRFI